ncbi:transposase family protein [Streptomyces prunicolor]|uniref:helix-turn-helix domain-containing protein n=1 Tax=Streptomyces prunicolor TaxID=67348 RepID=UPI0037158564
MGADAKHRAVFIDRFLATLAHLRHRATHDVLACWFGVDRSNTTRASTDPGATKHCIVHTGTFTSIMRALPGADLLPRLFDGDGSPNSRGVETESRPPPPRSGPCTGQLHHSDLRFQCFRRSTSY